MNNVVDDTLISLVSAELAHIGLIVPISEIETSAIKVYDNIQEAHRLDPNNKTVNSYVKDDRYYNVLKFATCAEIVSRVRLTKARNGYEAAATLAILQGYLDGLSETAGTVRTIASAVFKDILDGLPNVSIVTINQPSQNSVAYQQPTEQLKPIPLGLKFVQPKELNVCTNSVDRGSCDICSACEASPEFESCGDSVSISIMLKGMCYGIKFPPETLGLHELLYKNDLPDKINIFRNKIGLAARMLKKHAEEIFVGLYRAYHNQEDEDD